MANDKTDRSEEGTTTNQTIDCIFDINSTHVVLIRRDHEPFNGYWALPGGRQEKGETLENTVVREMEEETGIKINLVNHQFPFPAEVLDQRTYLDQVRTYHSGKDPRGGNTTVYAVQLEGKVEEIEARLRCGSDARDIGIFHKNDLPELAFDHKTFIKEYFKFLKRYKNPIPTTDIIIEYNDADANSGKGKQGIVLITRKNPPYGLALPGGFAECGISYEENAAKEAKEETGLVITIQNPRRPFVYSSPERDPRSHITSNTYIAKGHGKLKAGDDAASAKLYTLEEIAAMFGKNMFAFDHEQILKDYLVSKGYLEKSTDDSKKYKRLGVIGRFKPLHLGAYAMLAAMCEQAEHVVIGIGSSNKYNARNPFTAQETREMIDAALSSKFSNYSIVDIPDFAHIPEYKDGQRWVQEIKAQYGELDAFVSGDNYVEDLLKQHYHIVHPSVLIPKERWIYVRGSMVRAEMARGGENWKAFVPKEVSEYILARGLVERFKHEFGLETISSLANLDYMMPESSQREKEHTMEA